MKKRFLLALNKGVSCFLVLGFNYFSVEATGSLWRRVSLNSCYMVLWNSSRLPSQLHPLWVSWLWQVSYILLSSLASHQPIDPKLANTQLLQRIGNSSSEFDFYLTQKGIVLQVWRSGMQLLFHCKCQRSCALEPVILKQLWKPNFTPIIGILIFFLSFRHPF